MLITVSISVSRSLETTLVMACVQITPQRLMIVGGNFTKVTRFPVLTLKLIHGAMLPSKALGLRVCLLPTLNNLDKIKGAEAL